MEFRTVFFFSQPRILSASLVSKHQEGRKEGNEYLADEKAKEGNEGVGAGAAAIYNYIRFDNYVARNPT